MPRKTNPSTPPPSRPSKRPSVPSLPPIPSLDVVDFTLTRTAELQSLRQAAQSINPNRRVFQTLSWHARRRTMSHSSHRMPRHLRLLHQKQLAKQNKTDKRTHPSGKARMRKYRKKLRFWMAVRKLRWRKHGWLETHVWHAKRFRMSDVGGYKLPQRCNDRGTRSCFRAVRNACVVHDASYMQLVEVSSQETSHLKTALKKYMPWEHGRRSCTDPAVGGRRCVRALCVCEEGGGRCIGEVDLLWHKSGKKFWMWMRPQIVEPVAAVIGSVEGVNVQRPEKPPLLFRILGPRAGVVLSAVLEVGEMGDEGVFISGVRNASCLPEGCVYVGEATNPRMTFPPKTMGKHGRGVREFGREIAEVFRDVKDSELWEQKRREAWYDNVLNGKKTRAGNRERVPYILMQRGGYNGFASGWDLVVPAGWGMAFWASLMYSNGNRAVGMEEMRMIQVEAREALFPEDFVDSKAGYDMLRQEEQELRERYLRKPKGKRVNYQMYRFETPMFPDLVDVAKRERARTKADCDTAPPLKRPKSDEDERIKAVDVSIVRGKGDVQRYLGAAIRDLERCIPRQPPSSALQKREVAAHTQPLVNSHLCFLRVRIVAHGKGVPRKNAVMYLPTKGDIKQMKGKKYDGFRETLAKGTGKGCQELRKAVGYVTYGGFSLRNGGGEGVGLVAISGLRSIFDEGGAVGGQDRGGLILFRNVNSLHYRGAVIRLQSW